MSNLARQILLESNVDLLREVERLIALIEQVAPPPELERYRVSIHRTCQDLRQEVENNLDKVLNLKNIIGDESDARDAKIRTLLSETQRLNTDLKLYNLRFVSPLRRYIPEDLLPLRILHWLYETHAITRDIPVALTNSEFQVWPEIDKPTLYGVPISMQRGLLYQPLLFHEFGHQLFICFEEEMCKFIQDLQRDIALYLTPWIQGSDEQANRDRRRRKEIAETWYYWCEELFCDAIGLTIGGPAFLYALDRYVRLYEHEYHVSRSKLAYRTHPIFRLRMKLLVHQAKAFRFTAIADLIAHNWASLAAVLRANEDYYGFYEEAYFPIIQETLKKMIQEVDPYRFTDRDLSGDEWTRATTPVHLLNRAWDLYNTAPDTYADWEQEMIGRFCAE